jgi:RHS repeat-associated protein
LVFASLGGGGPAAITNSFTYNKRLQPLTMSATAPSQTVFSIGYDFHAGNGTAGSGTDNGNVYGITNYKDTTHGRDQTFTYDALNRLISAQNAGTNCATMVLGNKTEYWGNSYGYDAWGNLLQKNVTKCGAENLSVTADAHNWLHASGTDYQYDAAGNMTRNVTPTVQAYTYDEENRLTGAAGYTYTYDGDGNRVRKSNGNLAANGTLYWYMTPGVVAETDLAGTTKSEYIFFDGERVARRDGATGTGGVFYYFSDHLKTASVITDSAGVIKAESDYYPWGGELKFVDNDSNDYKFTGKKRDSETGLDYFGARYYSNGLGRWISADWSSTPVPVPYADLGDPQSLNLYTYVRNIPTTRIDESGHDDSFSAALQAWWNETTAAFSRFMSSKDGSQVTNSQPNPLTGVSTESIVADTNTKVGGTIDKMAGVITAIDPTGQSAALRSYLAGDKVGVGLAMATPLLHIPGGGEVTGLAKAFGFKEGFKTAEGIVAGELKNGGTALVNFAKAGDSLGVGISFVGSPKGVTGTLGAVQKGIINAGKASGASSVTVVAKNVDANLAKVLQKRYGFSEVIKDGKGTGNWTKTINLKE